MGFGGNLIWTGVFDALHRQHGQVAIACDTPMLTDVLRGYLYRRARSYRDDPIFRGNPDIDHIPIHSKTRLEIFIDRLAETFLSPDPLRRAWERMVFRQNLKRWRAGKAPLLVHIDMRIHSYAAAQDRRRTYWKSGGCASHVIAVAFGAQVKTPVCRFFPDDKERQTVKALLGRLGVDGAYIVLEPDTNRDWFGNLRAWPLSRWQELVIKLHRDRPDLALIQTGLGEGGVLDGVINCTGKTSFRESASLLEGARLFVGTEGGLMHLAAATGVPSVILWGGLTLPEFAGYPHLHRILCHYVACAPCGNAGWCDKGHQCMTLITVTEVTEAVKEVIGAKE